MNSPWELQYISDVKNKNFVVTGANTGLGLKSVTELANAGANVVLTCRDISQGVQLAKEINNAIQREAVISVWLDLVDLDSIAQCAAVIIGHFDKLDGLINNAGVVNLPKLTHSPSGHEMHMATNHFGHFALTGHLFNLLISTPNSRVVTVSSGGYRAGVINFEDLDWKQRTYSRVKAYGDSKLANLLFMRELQTKFEQAGATSLSVAAHPGLTGTERQQNIGIGGKLTKCLASPVSTGVAPQLFAATDSTVSGRDFYGPKYGIWGPPKKLKVKGNVLNQALAQKLWLYSSELTKVTY